MKFINILKLKFKILKIDCKDLFSSNRFSKKRKNDINKKYIAIKQKFVPNPTLENKKHNVKIASKEINQYVIFPNEIFSFWRAVGNPNDDKKFKKGRGIVKGQLQEETGGGLCQLSGILYHLSLIGNLDIIERHPHSLDIYTAETRYTPLGTDATVSYGNKDLRIANNTKSAIRFFVEVEDDFLTAKLYSEDDWQERRLKFVTQEYEKDFVKSKIFDQEGKLVSTSLYKKL